MMPSGSQSQPSSQQSFSMSQQSQPGLASSGYRPYDTSRMPDEAPQIYSAVYSGVDVYEMEVHGIAVMRRRNDSWLNATQILKVAGVDKGKRTKILEKEIQTGEHEKVQGGYGKYQGTWIKFERGVEVCRQYGVEDLLRPLLTYDMGQDGSLAGRGDLNTPTKEQAMAAQRKRMYNAANEARTNGLSGTFFKNISSTASHAVAAISKARFESPGPRARNGGPTRAPSFSRQSSISAANHMPANGPSLDDLPPNSQQSFVSDYGHQSNPSNSQHFSTQRSFALSHTQQSHTHSQPPHHAAHAAALETTEPPRKRQRVTMTPADGFSYHNAATDALQDAFPGSPTEPNESFIYSQAVAPPPAPPPHDGYSPLEPLRYDITPEAEHKRSMLMSLFMDVDQTAPDPSKYDVLRSLSPLELDMPIDHQYHTALHWAATLSRMPLLKALISAGANPFRVNAMGETALMRACVVTNSMDHGSFPDLLEVLGSTIDVRDSKGRTVLHHIAMTSAVKGRNAASRYYLESLLEWVVRQGSVPAPAEPANEANGGGGDSAPPSSQSQHQKMGIGRFMTEVVNVQDSSGDTALNIAARIGNRSIISQLLEVHADPHIANRAGLCPLDFGIGDGIADAGDGEHRPGQDGHQPTNNVKSIKGSIEHVLASITHLLNETHQTFQTEMKSRQASLDSLHASLRTGSTQLSEARRSLESLQQTVRKQQLARQRVANLSHAREEEQGRLTQEQTRTGRDSEAAAWETELGAVLEAAGEGTGNDASSAAGLLPTAAVLRARITAVGSRRDVTRNLAQALRGRSRDVEVQYRRVVAMCTGVPEDEVDAVVDGLLRAVESEKGDLEVSRVRRFLSGVESVVN